MESLKGLYHADKLDEQTFIDNFTIRLKEYRQIIDSLTQQKQKPLQHFLITGKRGMGKSTLSRRIYLEACTPPLSEKMFAVRLGAEQYRLSRLFKLWELIIEHLGNTDQSLLDERRQMEDSRNYQENIVHIITDYLAKTKKTLLLLIDNFDQFIEKLSSKDKHMLREILIQYPIQIIGNTVFYNEHFKSYNEPFYDFFKPVRLENLDKEEADDFIKLRAASEGLQNFTEVFEQQYSKVQTLRILSGGVPRTLLLLLSIISKKNTGDAVDYLHEMIEQVTPLYQDRMKALSSQQQEIMHHLAMHWDRTPVKDLAKEMRIPSKSISAQLVALESMGYVNKVETKNRNNYYEIDERFFNIWLLMSEAPPYDSKRVIWLTKWLDAFYSNEELKDYAKFCHNSLRTAKPGNRFLIAQALSESEKLDDGYKRKMVKETAESLRGNMKDAVIWENTWNKKMSEKIDLLFNKLKGFIEANDFTNALKDLIKIEEISDSPAYRLKGFIYHMQNDIANAEKYYLLAIENGNNDAMVDLAQLYQDEKKDIVNAEKYFLLAAEKGNVDASFNLAILYQDEKKDIVNAEKYFLLASEKGNDDANYFLGFIYYVEKRDFINAEKYLLLAAEKGDNDAMFLLANLYFETNAVAKKNNALELCIKASKIEKEPSISILTYVITLLWNQKVKEASDKLLQIINGPLLKDENTSLISYTLQYFLIFRQKQFLYKLFTSNQQLTDRYKPVYYALMHELQDEYPNEYLKMTEELQEPVNAILDFVKKEQIRLAV